MPKSLGEPEPTEGRVEPSDIEQLDQSSGRYAPQEEKTSSEGTSSPPDESVRPPDAEAKGAAQSQDWWSTSQPAGEWAQPAATTAAGDVDVPQESATADVYFCGQKTLLSLSRALQAIANEKLTGVLRSFWDREPIELLTQNGEIVFATTRDPDLYCQEMPAVLANVDAEIAARARAQQSERGPVFLSPLGSNRPAPTRDG
jgi:hypothetical protein